MLPSFHVPLFLSTFNSNSLRLFTFRFFLVEKFFHIFFLNSSLHSYFPAVVHNYCIMANYSSSIHLALYNYFMNLPKHRIQNFIFFYSSIDDEFFTSLALQSASDLRCAQGCNNLTVKINHVPTENVELYVLWYRLLWNVWIL